MSASLSERRPGGAQGSRSGHSSAAARRTRRRHGGWDGTSGSPARPAESARSSSARSRWTCAPRFLPPHPALVVHRAGDPLVPVALARYVAERIAEVAPLELDGDWHLNALEIRRGGRRLLDAIEDVSSPAVPLAGARRRSRARNGAHAADAERRRARRAGRGSIQRLSIEYDGCWMRSGVPEPAQDRGRLARALGRVRRDADVERLALADGGVERAQRLLERRVRVEAVRVEDVDVVEAQPPRLWSRLASRYLREPRSPYGPGHMS